MIRESTYKLDFYPRSPCGERQHIADLMCLCPNFYPRSPCGERLHYDNYNLHCVEISIHALLAESDERKKLRIPVPAYFYPRSPCGERLYDTYAKSVACQHFYPRSPCGERRPDRQKTSMAGHFYPRALLAESDSIIVLIIRHVHAFLSTLSLRRATSLMLL